MAALLLLVMPFCGGVGGHAFAQEFSLSDDMWAEPSEPKDARDDLSRKSISALMRQVRRTQKSNPRLAKDIYEEIIRRTPYHYKARFELAKLLSGSNPAKALEHLNVAARVFPGSDSVQYRMGMVLERLNRPLESAESYRKAIRLNPRHYSANKRLRSILRGMRARQGVIKRASEGFFATPNLATLTLFGQVVIKNASPREAVLQFEEVLEEAPGLAEAHIWIARAKHAVGDLDGEVESYRAYLRQNDEAVGVRLMLLQRMHEAGYYREALAELKSLGKDFARDEPKKSQARITYLQSRINSAQEFPDAAATLLLEAARLGHNSREVKAAFAEDLALHHDNGTVWLAYGRWLKQRGEYQQAGLALRQAGVLSDDTRGDSRKELQDMLQKDQALPAVNLALGEIAFADGDEKSAIAHLSDLPPGHALDARASLLRGRIHRKRGEIEESIDAFLRYVLFFKGGNDATFAKGNMFWALDRKKEALAAWKKDPGILEKHPDVLLQVAEYYRKNGDRKAELSFRKSLAKAMPGNHPNSLRLGTLYKENGRPKQAIKHYNRVLKVRPRDYKLLIMISKAHLELEQFQEALPLLQRASRLKALDPEMNLMLARGMFERKQYADALREYWALAQTQPNHPDLPKVLPDLALNVPSAPEVRRMAFDMAVAEKRNDVAIELLAGLLKEGEEQLEDRVTLAALYLESGKNAEAVAVLKPTGDTAKDPKSTRKRLEMLAGIQEKMKHKAGLLDTLNQLQVLLPDDTDLMRNRGVLMAGLNRVEAAHPLLKIAVEKNSDDDEARLALARAELKKRNSKAGEKHLVILLKKNGDNLTALQLMIELTLDRKKLRKAMPLMEHWVTLNPDDAIIRRNLISLNLLYKRKPEARIHYEALQRINPKSAKRFAKHFTQ